MNTLKQPSFLNFRVLSIVFIFATSITTVFSQKTQKNEQKKLVLVSEHKGPIVGKFHEDVLSSKNRSGFETGQVVKINGVYHMFINEMFDRPHKDMRIAYWTSSDAINWKRQSTIVESIPGRSPSNPKSEVWVTGVEFNTEENAWDIFYVSYRSGDKEKGELEQSDYEGKIWRAKSVITGVNGIAGPYAELGIVLQPDENSQSWEGQQAVASFNPYKVGDKWYAMYDGHNYIPKGPWPVGLATADKLSGPWKRFPEGTNPLPIADVFAENTVITELKKEGYLTLFDSLGDQEIGYSISDDGLKWSKETRVKVQSGENLWAESGDHSTRTPLCAIEEADGTFTVIYTAIMKEDGENFYAIGKCSIGWE
ncbi:MAG: hypothetical protein PHS59_03845 [Paludibacter sp.]|nr:hypothetical protein [Paludibacter sp.]